MHWAGSPCLTIVLFFFVGTASRLLSATSVKVDNGFRLALPTGAYHTWQGAVLEGTPIEPDLSVGFDWRARRTSGDGQVHFVISAVRKMSTDTLACRSLLNYTLLDKKTSI